MSDAVDDLPPPEALPKESDRRVIEDADAVGIPVVLQGGEVWYVAPLPLSPRGVKVAALIDTLEADEVAHTAAQRKVALASGRLDAAADEAAVDRAEAALRAAVAERNRLQSELRETHREIAWHALRSCYRLTIDEVSRLVTQRHWPDVISALNGCDTQRSQQEMAIALFERLHAAAGRGKPDGGDPFAPPSSRSSATAAASSSPAASSPTA